MSSEELTKNVNEKINQIGNRVNLLQRGGCLQQLKSDLEKITGDVRGLIIFIDELENKEVNL